MPVVISTMSIYGLFSIKVANISCCCSIMENALNGAKKKRPKLWQVDQY
jgi:hypothetical protein